MTSEPQGQRNDWHPQSPDYRGSGIEDMDLEDLIAARDRALSVAEDSDASRSARMSCEAFLSQANYEITLRLESAMGDEE